MLSRQGQRCARFFASAEVYRRMRAGEGIALTVSFKTFTEDGAEGVLCYEETNILLCGLPVYSRFRVSCLRRGGRGARA